MLKKADKVAIRWMATFLGFAIPLCVAENLEFIPQIITSVWVLGLVVPVILLIAVGNKPMREVEKVEDELIQEALK